MKYLVVKITQTYELPVDQDLYEASGEFSSERLEEMVVDMEHVATQTSYEWRDEPYGF